MTARKQLATQIVLLTSLLLLGAPVVADNANTTTMEVPVDSTGPDPCTGDDVRHQGSSCRSCPRPPRRRRPDERGHVYGDCDGGCYLEHRHRSRYQYG